MLTDWYYSISFLSKEKLSKVSSSCELSKQTKRREEKPGRKIIKSKYYVENFHCKLHFSIFCHLSIFPILLYLFSIPLLSLIIHVFHITLVFIMLKSGLAELNPVLVLHRDQFWWTSLLHFTMSALSSRVRFSPQDFTELNNYVNLNVISKEVHTLVALACWQKERKSKILWHYKDLQIYFRMSFHASKSSSSDTGCK